MNVNGVVDRPRQTNSRKVEGPKLVWRQESPNMLRNVFLSIGKIMKTTQVLGVPSSHPSLRPSFAEAILVQQPIVKGAAR
jgi:hypothetical protein